MVDMEVFVVMNKLKELELKALEMRHQHLKSRLQATKDEKNNTVAAAILRTIHCEANRKR